MSNKIKTVSIGDLPIATELDDADELLLRDVSATLPENATARLSIATLRAAMGGGADDWSEFPATSSVDMDGHGLTNLPAPSAASDAATKGYVDARPGAEEWSEHPATQDVDLDGHKLTGLGAPTEEDDAATKAYVDGAAPTKIERTFWWGRSVAEVTDNGDIELATYRTGEEGDPLRRVRVPRGDTGGPISLMNRNDSGFVSTLSVSTTSPSLTYTVTGGPSGGATSRGGVSFSQGVWRFTERNGAEVPLGSEGYYALPSGVSSIKHGVHLAKEAYDTLAGMPAPPELEWWEPVWTPVSNVDSVSNIECQYTRTYRAAGGSLVTLEGTIEVTPEAADTMTMVSVDLPVPRDGVDIVAGIGSFTDYDGDDFGLARAGVADLGAGQQVSVQYTPSTDAVHRVSFRVSYRAE